MSYFERAPSEHFRGLSREKCVVFATRCAWRCLPATIVTLDQGIWEDGGNSLRAVAAAALASLGFAQTIVNYNILRAAARAAEVIKNDDAASAAANAAYTGLAPFVLGFNTYAADAANAACAAVTAVDRERPNTRNDDSSRTLLVKSFYRAANADLQAIRQLDGPVSELLMMPLWSRLLGSEIPAEWERIVVCWREWCSKHGCDDVARRYDLVEAGKPIPADEILKVLRDRNL